MTNTRKYRTWWGHLWLGALLSACCLYAQAGEVVIEFVALERQGDGAWRASVTLRHADTGWDHYADAWRVVLDDGTVVGTRTLYHPHVDEQPFTRSLSSIEIPPEETTVYIEARDTVHGWAPARVVLDLETLESTTYKVVRP